MVAKILGLVLLVLAVWAGAEILTKGTDGAFGGLFAGFRTPAQPAEPIPKKIGAKVQNELNGAMERRMGDEEDNN